MPIRTTFYIDGFNFYHGIKHARSKLSPKWKDYYWIDLVAFCKQFLSEHHELVAVKYFTAPPLDNEKEKRQSALFKANKFLNGDKIEYIKGKYYEKSIRCQGDCKGFFKIYEEKRTDVNISVEIIGDCAFNKTDLIVLISADSDLVPPIEYITKNFPDKKVKIFFPPCRKSTDLMKLVDKVIFLDSNELKFRKSIMNHKIHFEGREVTIPDKWRSDTLLSSEETK